MIKKFSKYYKPHIKLFIFTLTCAFLISLSDLIFPMITRQFINTIIPNGQLNLLLNLTIIMVFLFLFKYILDYIVTYYGHMLGVRIEYDMRRDLFAHIETLSFDYFDKNKTGHLMSRLVNDLNDISELAHHGPEDIFISTVMLIGSFLFLMTINVKLTLIIFAVIPFLIFFSIYFNNKLRNNFRRMRKNIADINSGLENTISGIKVVKSFTNETYEEEKFDVGNKTFRRIRSESFKYLGAFNGGLTFITNIISLIALSVGGYFVYLKQMNYGDLTAFIIFINQFLQPIKRLANLVEEYQRGMAGFTRFAETMNERPSLKESENAVNVNVLRGDIKFKNVYFKYEEGDYVLKDINLHIKEGETVAIVGPSGVGKTTLLSLIPRFYDTYSGSVTVDDINVKDMTLKSLRSNIGIVQQDIFLFDGTIRENIQYGKLNASFDEIVSAAKAANAHEFIVSMPNGYDTQIGERGAKLSGGQKQRVSIARMFLKNPPILILDEATSSLDNQSEQIIKEEIEILSKNRTTLIIAHRFATIKNAERIIVINEGGIVEEGEHNELIRKNGVYSNLYNTQF